MTPINSKNWFVYIIETSDKSYYTGITTNIERRFAEHLNGKRGAKYFNGRSPVKIVFSEANHDRSSASKREASIKSLSRVQKKQLINVSPET
ncbi:MAG: GIY-YIG nuclease family protein [Gammaproteobacteria bacterium]|nr:GIY-YIG nuclease family protein [Gammaproteobacteria bacterium]